MSGFGYNVLGFGANASSAAGGASDDEFNRVSFLSHFEGSNNGVNNVFDDGSDSNHTITANGNVTQGSFNPYGTNWSVDFSRDTNPRLSSPASSDFTLGTGDFTIEFFVFFNTIAGVQKAIKQDTASGQTGFTVATGDGTGKFTFGGVLSETTSDAVANKWYHIAITRNSGVFRIFRNGVQTDTDTSSVNFGSAAKLVYGGSDDLPIKGLMSNLRLVQGTSLYDSNFTTPTSPLTAVTNTKLLTLQSNRFVDNSASGHAVQPNTAKEAVTAFGPFLTSTVYDPAVNGANAYVDGSGDYLNCTVNSDFSFGTADFSIEYYTYRTGADGAIFGAHASGQADGYYSYTSPPRLEVFSNGGGGGGINSNENTQKNSWFHVVISRQSGRLRIFIDGVLKNSTTTAYTINSDGRMFVVGGVTDGAGPYDGYITGFRVVNGSCAAAYQTSSTTNGAVIFTPPTAPVTAVTNTKLLLNMADGQAIDSAAQNNLTLIGNTDTSTGQAKFGNTSLFYDGSGDGAYYENGAALSTGDWTIETFLWVNDFDADLGVFQYGGADGALGSLVVTNQKIKVVSNNTAVRLETSGTINAQTWYHVAYVSYNGTIKVYINGTADSVTFDASSTTWTFTDTTVYVGARYYNSAVQAPFDGYLDEFRVSHFARYTSNFTAPTVAFPDKGQ